MQIRAPRCTSQRGAQAVRPFLAAILMAVLAVGCSESATEPLPDTSEPRVVFISNRDGNYEIYSMKR